MATKRIPILGHATRLDGQAGMSIESLAVKATNDAWPYNVVVFDGAAGTNSTQPTARIGLYGRFTVPQDFVSTAKLFAAITSTITSGAMVCDFDYRTVGGDDATSLDQAGTEQSVTATKSAPTAGMRRLEVEIALTDANFSPGETVQFGFFRDGTDGADTLAGAMLLESLEFKYSDV